MKCSSKLKEHFQFHSTIRILTHCEEFAFVSGLQRDVKTMEESESGINLQEMSSDDEDKAKKKEAKEKEEREKQGTLIPIARKCY